MGNQTNPSTGLMREKEKYSRGSSSNDGDDEEDLMTLCLVNHSIIQSKTQSFNQKLKLTFPSAPPDTNNSPFGE